MNYFMFNRLNNLLYGFWGILIFVSCNEKKVEDGQLLRAEALMASSPDSSYRILRSVFLSQNRYITDCF